MVGTALRAVRNDAPLMLRWRHIADARDARPYHLSHWVARRWRFIADARDARPYHLSHWVARRFQNVANVQVLPVSNWPLANGIGYWQQWQHSSGPLPAILRDILLLVPSLWLASVSETT